MKLMSEEHDEDYYKNAKIYKLVDNTNGNIYIGSTVRTLKQRLRGHENKYNMYLKGTQLYYGTSFYILENEDYNIHLLERVKNCKSKRQLHERERYYIENCENCVNKVVPTRTKKEYTICHKQDKAEYDKVYRELNRDHRLQLKRDHYYKNKEAIQAKLKAKIYCDACNYEVSKGHYSAHCKSQTHIQNANA
jgi:hypothetical protein